VCSQPASLRGGVSQTSWRVRLGCRGHPVWPDEMVDSNQFLALAVHSATR